MTETPHQIHIYNSMYSLNLRKEKYANFSSIIGKLQKAQFLLFISAEENRKKNTQKELHFF